MFKYVHGPPKIVHYGAKKVKMTPQIKSSKVRMEGNIDNKICSTT